MCHDLTLLRRCYTDYRSDLGFGTVPYNVPCGSDDGLLRRLNGDGAAG